MTDCTIGFGTGERTFACRSCADYPIETCELHGLETPTIVTEKHLEHACELKIGGRVLGPHLRLVADNGPVTRSRLPERKPILVGEDVGNMLNEVAEMELGR